MKNASTYLTLSTSSESLYKEKGSKFFGYAFPVFSEEEVKEKLAEIRTLHHTARHHCYGYRLGLGKEERYRANDDGEPSNSAGKPIYGQLLSADVTNVLIIVVRYFGGTKLGVGGLISAYKTSAKLALENGKIIQQEEMNYYKLVFNYPEMSEVMNTIKQRKLEIVSQLFESSCEIELRLPIDSSETTAKLLEEINQVKVSFLEKK